MTILNVTIDDISPMVHELSVLSTGARAPTFGAWNGADSAVDGSQPLTNYFEGTSTLTATRGATLSIDFNGTAIWLYGSVGPRHCEYNVTVDGLLLFRGNSFALTQQFQQVLYSNTSLPMGLHTLHYINDQSDPLINVTDLDFVTWTTVVGDANSTLSTQHVTVLNNSAWALSSSTEWSLNPAGSNQYTNLSNVQGTQTDGATATLVFEVRDAVTVFGGTGAATGQYSITLDSQLNPNVFDAEHDGINANRAAVLYYADNLGPGTHSLILTNKPNAEVTPVAQQLWIEAANITTAISNSTRPSGTSSSSVPTTSASAQPASNNTPTAVIAGAVVGGAVLVVLGIFIFFLVRRLLRVRAGRMRDLTPFVGEFDHTPQASTAPTLQMGAAGFTYSFPHTRSSGQTIYTNSALSDTFSASTTHTEYTPTSHQTSRAPEAPQMTLGKPRFPSAPAAPPSSSSSPFSDSLSTRRELDGGSIGVLMSGQGEASTLLPPAYTDLDHER